MLIKFKRAINLLQDNSVNFENPLFCMARQKIAVNMAASLAGKSGCGDYPGAFGCGAACAAYWIIKSAIA